MEKITNLYVCPIMGLNNCNHYNCEDKTCCVALDIGKLPTEYIHCEGYEPTDTLIEKEF